MNYDYTWGNNDSDIQVMVKGYGLKPAQPIMCSTPESGNCMSIFQSGSKHYLWNPIEGDICEIVTAMNGVDIVTKIAKQGLKSLKLAEVPQVSTSPADFEVEK
jgi:hypothetical protein